MAEYKLKGSDLYDSKSNKLATIKGNDIYDNRSNKVGVVRGMEIYDSRQNKLAFVKGSDIYDARHNKIGTLDSVKKTIEGATGGTSLAAFWLFFVR